MPDTDSTTRTLSAIDQMLKLCEVVRAGKHRDPIRAMEDVLLEWRHEVTA